MKLNFEKFTSCKYLKFVVVAACLTLVLHPLLSHLTKQENLILLCCCCCSLLTSACLWQSVTFSLTLNVLYHTIPHMLCGSEVKDMHRDSALLKHNLKQVRVSFYPLSKIRNLFLIFRFSEQNSAILFSSYRNGLQSLKVLPQTPGG